MLTFSGCSNWFAPEAPPAMPNKLEVSQVDIFNNEQRVSAYQESFICTRIDDASVQFQYNIADYDVRTELVNGGTIVQDRSQAVISSGTDPFGEAHIESVESVRYRPGHEAWALYTAAFLNGGVANVEQLTGVYNEDEDGFVIGYNGTTPIVGRINGGDKFFVPRDQWDDPLNGTGPSGCSVDFSKLHQFNINYGWLGIAQINFGVQCGVDKRWVPFHTIDLTDTTEFPTINNPVLPIQMHVIKNNSTENVTIRTSSWAGGVCNGGKEARQRSFVAHITQPLPANQYTSLLTIKSNQSFFGKTNRIDAVLKTLDVGTDGNKNVEIYLIRNSPNITLNDNQYARINANNSIMGVNYTQFVIDPDLGELLGVYAFGKSDARDIDLGRTFLDFHKNETISVIAFSTNTNEVITTLGWEELY